MMDLIVKEFNSHGRPFAYTGGHSLFKVINTDHDFICSPRLHSLTLRGDNIPLTTAKPQEGEVTGGRLFMAQLDHGGQLTQGRDGLMIVVRDQTKYNRYKAYDEADRWLDHIEIDDRLGVKPFDKLPRLPDIPPVLMTYLELCETNLFHPMIERARIKTYHSTNPQMLINQFVALGLFFTPDPREGAAVFHMTPVGYNLYHRLLQRLFKQVR